MKIAVIGTGVMGRIHVRVLRNIERVSEIVISDINKSRLDDTKTYFGINKAYLSHTELLEKESLDGVIVATPPQNHKEIVIDALSAGINVLVEKPIAHNVKHAQTMINAARKKKVIFTVGHAERFNPVVTKIKEFIENDILNKVYLINTHRVGPFPKRMLGKIEGVLIDLAVHDFDLIHYLGSEIINVKSQIINSLGQEVYVKTLMNLKNNIKASCEFSWVTPHRKRLIELYASSGMVVGDFYKQELIFYENSDFSFEEKFNKTFIETGLINTGRIIQHPIIKQEPIKLEINNFLDAIIGVDEVLVKPEDALNTLKNVLKIRTK